MLSKRGNLAVDERSNKLFVQGWLRGGRCVRRLIAEIDLARPAGSHRGADRQAMTLSRARSVREGFGGVFGSTNAAGIPCTK